MTALASPCTGVCKLDEATGWCLGCARTGEEIGDWRGRSPAQRDAVWRMIPGRLSQLGVACRRLPWTTQDIKRFVAQSWAAAPDAPSGRWVIGVEGAVAEFAPAPGAPIATQTTAHAMIARTTNAALSLQINDDVRALTFEPEGTPMEASRIVLAVKRERGRLPLAQGVADLGPDRGTLLPGENGHLFDLGLGRKEARFCVRVVDAALAHALHRATGHSLRQMLPALAPTLRAKSPTRVVESALGRIEVQGRIPEPGTQSPAGSHTHLLPDHLASGRAMPVGMDLPRAYLPGAIFYPAPIS